MSYSPDKKKYTEEERAELEKKQLELFADFKKTGDDSIRDELIKSNVHVVYPIARKYRNSNENFEDLIQVGYIGLIKAVDNFDPDRGVKFFTYATHCIMGEIRHYIRDKTEPIKRPRWLKKLNRDVAKFVEEFLQNKERLPTVKEIADELNISEEGIIEIFKSKKVLSLTELSDDHGNQVDINRIRSIRYETFRLPIEDRIVLEDTIEKLKEIEKEVILLFFYKDLTQTQIAVDLGLSQKKVSRMLHKTIAKMRKMIFSEKTS